MAPSTIRMVLMEGQNADGVTVDQDGFDVDGYGGAVSDRVVSAILGTRESAQEGGYQLTSTGVMVGDQAQAGLLRDALADRKVRNVTLVSAFLAAAALAQATGGAIGYARTALLFVQPDSATLAVVDSADGAITEVHRVVLPTDDARAMAELIGLTTGAAGLMPRPDGILVVGSGVNVGIIKPKLEAASRLPVNAPEEPELALARGAALASAHTPLLESSTSAVAWARDPGTGVIDPELAALGYAYVSNTLADYDATAAEAALAYSAVGGDDPGSGYLPIPDGGGEQPGAVEPPGAGAAETNRRHRPLLLAGSALAALIVAGVATLVIAIAVGIRPLAAYRPVPVPHTVPAQQAPAPAPNMEQPAAPAPPPAALPAPPPAAQPAPPVAAPAPKPSAQPAPPPSAPVQPQLPAARQVPAPAPAAPPAVPAPEQAAPPVAPVPIAPPPAPAPEAPAPVPAAPIPIPIPIPILLPAPIPAPAAPAPRPAAPPVAPKPSAPALPPIFNPPTQTPPKTGGGWPGTGDGQRGGGLFPGWPGSGGAAGGGQHGGGLFPGWPGSGGGAGGGHGGGFPGLGGGGGARGGHGGFRF
ncbi:MAG TPA: hypothetical protein VFR27_17490 [Mycobacterium sp.]|nr:hypothetical protein [Mycobacterium sp.]